MEAASPVAGEFAPDPAGTKLPDGGVWGSFDEERVSFEGDVDVVLAERSVEIVASGFRWTEGPTWLSSERALLFSDTIDARVYRWTAEGGVSVWLESSGGYDGANVEDHDMLFEPGSNGMALHGDDLYICQHPTHRVVKLSVAGVKPGSSFCENDFTVLADSFNDKRLNSPNDVVVGPDGHSVWFTDPVYGFLRKSGPGAFLPVLPEQPPEPSCHNPGDMPYLDECAARGVGHKGVYRWRDGQLQLAIATQQRPNGLAFTPDGKALWVADSHSTMPKWVMYALKDELPLEPLLTLGEKELGPMPGPGLPDGFKIDKDGLIWSTMPSGICVIDPNPAAPRIVAKIVLHTNVSNIEFGAEGDVWVTGIGHVWRLRRRL